MLFADDDILNLLHRVRPKFLGLNNSIPLHYDPYDFQHQCCLNYMENREVDAFDLEHENESTKCADVPFVGPYDFHADEVARKFASIVKEVKHFGLTGSASCDTKVIPHFLIFCKIDENPAYRGSVERREYIHL